MNDELDLINRISKSDEKAFEELFNRYFHYLHNVAFNRLGSAEVADDIIQDIFTDLWKNRSKIDIHTSVKSYLYQAVKNRVYKFIRHQAIRQKEVYIRKIYDEYYSGNPFAQSHDLLEEEELKELISKHLNELPDKSRDIFLLSREKHFTHQEIAEKLNCSPKTVEYHISKVLRHLRLNLKGYVIILIPVTLL